MLVVANTVRASLVRGSDATSLSQFSTSADDNTPEDDNGVTSDADMESEFIELRTFSSRTSWDDRGAISGLEGAAPMTWQVVEVGDSNPTIAEVVCPTLQLWKTPHVMGGGGARGSQSASSH